MSDLISREQAIDMFRRYDNSRYMQPVMIEINYAITMLNSVPSAQKTGRWDNIKISITGESSAECSLCGAVVHNNFSNTINYCPNCGAKIEGGDAK